MRGELTVEEYMAGLGVDMLHAGGMKRTEDLAEMCRVSRGKSVLDVGCGYGKTASFLVKKYDCEVFGLDISRRMIEGARKKVREEHVRDIVHLLLGNAESMPFKDESFDVVISEGTTVFLEKEKALKEYVRVTKHGGYIGLNELSWRKEPPRRAVERAFNDLQGVQPLKCEEWIKLLVDSGLEDVESRTYRYKSFSWDVIRSIGLHALVKVGVKYLIDSRIRRWISRQEAVFHNYSEYWGYGLYSGRKP